MCDEQPNTKRLAAIAIDADVLATWCTAKDNCFDWVKRLVCFLPRGKGWVPRKLGNIILKNKKVLFRMDNGVLFAVVSSSLDTYISNCKYSGGTVTEMCRRILDPGKCFFDIGANIGVVSLAIAKAFEDRVYIYAFEPQAEIARHISLSAALNGFRNVSVYQTLVGELDCEADLFLGDASTHASLASSDHTAGNVRCRMISIDQQIQLGALPSPHVVKIDVEGAEFRVFKGMEHLIRTHSPIIIFEADQNMSRFGITCSQLLDYLKSLADYNFYFLQPDPARKDRIRRLENLADSNGGNFLVAPAKDLEIKKRLFL